MIARYARSMFRTGTDTNDVKMEDVLCDFCLAPWIDTLPFMEGHQGSHICGPCVTLAWRATVIFASEPPYTDIPACSCTMCLEQRIEPAFDSSKREAHICRRCVKMAAVMLERDVDNAWQRPER